MSEANRQCTKMCFCAIFDTGDDKISVIVESAKKLFGSGRQTKLDKALEKVGIYNFEKTYKTSTFGIEQWISIMPSKSTFFEKSKKLIDSSNLKAKIELEDLTGQYETTFGKKDSAHLFIGMDCEPTEPSEKLNIATLEKSPHVEKFTETIKPLVSESVVFRNCINLVYSTKNFRLIGGFPLPTKIPIPEKVLGRLGEANVSGLVLSFKDSPLGINVIEIKEQKHSIRLFVTFSTKMQITKKILHHIYEYGVQITDLFVEEIEK